MTFNTSPEGYVAFSRHPQLPVIAQADNFCGGTWQSLPGNSSKPPATIPDNVVIIVTDTVVKNGANISGNIKDIVVVQHDGRYGPNPGHRGGGPVTTIVCQ